MNRYKLIVIDRTIDLLSPLCTQLTYEGLIDEISHIHVGTIKFTPSTKPAPSSSNSNPSISPSPSPSSPPPVAKIQVALNSKDKLFGRLRNSHFENVAPILNATAHQIDDTYKQRHAVQTIHELKEYFSQFEAVHSDHKTLSLHTELAQKIQLTTMDIAFKNMILAEQNELQGVASSFEFISQLMDRNESPIRVLRLICIRSLANDGLPPSELERFRETFLQTYGYDQLFTFYNIENAGLIFDKSSPFKNTPFRSIAHHYRLLNPRIDVRSPADPSYVFSGYTPLSVAYIQSVLAGSTQDHLSSFPSLTRHIAPPLNDVSARNCTSILVFLGGITFAEMAALRFLAQQPTSPLSRGPFIVITTKVINGNSFIGSLCFPAMNPALKNFLLI